MKRILSMLLVILLLSSAGGGLSKTVEYTPEELLLIWEGLISRMREAACYPYVELRRGDRGYEVIFLQTRLAELNYYGKAIDPAFGAGTQAAMRMFESVHRLPVNGVASVEDQQLLFSSQAKYNPGMAAGGPGGGSPRGSQGTQSASTATPTPGDGLPDPGIGSGRRDKFRLPTPTPSPTPKPSNGFEGIDHLINIERVDLFPTATPKPGRSIDVEVNTGVNLENFFPTPTPKLLIPELDLRIPNFP